MTQKHIVLPRGTKNKIANGEVIHYRDLEIERLGRDHIEEGDRYVAERNTGAHLLTAKQVNNVGRWVVPVESAYSYDLWECVPVMVSNVGGRYVALKWRLHDGRRYRVWNDNWASDQFEVLTSERFDMLKEFCTTFGIQFEEALD